MSNNYSQIIKYNGRKRIEELKEVQNSYRNNIITYRSINNNLEIEKEELQDNCISTEIDIYNSRIKKSTIVLTFIELSILSYLTYNFSFELFQIFPMLDLAFQIEVISFYSFTLLLLFRSKICLFWSNLFFGLIIISYYICLFFPKETAWYYLLIPIVIFELFLIYLKPLRTLSFWGILGIFAVTYLLDYTTKGFLIFIPIGLIFFGLLVSSKFKNLYFIPQKIMGIILLFNFTTVLYAISNLNEFKFPYILNSDYLTMIHEIFDIQLVFLKSSFDNSLYILLLSLVIAITIIKEILYFHTIRKN